jgi:putative membrane protein
MDKSRSTYLMWTGRTLALWVSEIVGFMAMAVVIPGFQVDGWESAAVAVTFIGLLNALLWPLLSYYTLRFLVFTFGVGALILNGFMIWIASQFVPGLSISGGALLLVPLGIAAINTLVSAVITIDDEASYYRTVLRRDLERRAKGIDKNKPGFIFLEIDGLAASTLKKAIKNGYMPTLKKWLEDGTHRIKEWETDLSSQTGASQAGILHGNNKDLPAFRWVEKENKNKLRVSTGLFDAPLIEKRVSNGNGLLSTNGASRSNLFSGDAINTIFTYSKISNLGQFYTRAWYFFYSNPYNFTRTLILSLWDMVMEMGSRIRQRIKHINPRLKRSLIYFPIRATANVFLREVTTYTLLGDMLTGKVDAAYATYVGYDEIAHHSGVEDYDAFYALKKIDKQFQRLENAKKTALRPYHLVVLSDHGQSNGATFKQRYKMTLEDLVRELLPEDIKIHSDLYTNVDHFSQAVRYPITEGKDFINQKTANTVESGRKVGRSVMASFTENQFVKRTFKSLDMPEMPHKKFYKGHEDTYVSPEEAQTVVLASGNLGLIYFNEWSDRMTYEELNLAFPNLIPGLIQHNGIGFIMVRSEEHGTVVIGSRGTYYLETDTFEGENPIASFGKNAAHHLKRTDNFKYVPDILVNSFYNPETREVAAFEELIGSHGGMGGNQSKPFIMHPSEWKIDEEEIVGAENVYKTLKTHIHEAWNNYGTNEVEEKGIKH